MLHPMQRGNESAPSPSAANFAGLLASLTAPKQPAKWNDDDLADDVATLSYENALRAHARYRAPDRTDRSLTQAAPADSDRIDSYELAPVDETPADRVASPFAGPRVNADNKQSAGAKAQTDFEAPAAPVRPRSGQVFESSSVTKQTSSVARDSVRHVPTLLERNLKTASITIRMSRKECDQLHLRAEEAGLTISAYLRSCTFEAESLRALVKDTMAQLQAANGAEKQCAPTQPPSGGRLRRIFTPWRCNRGAARA